MDRQRRAEAERALRTLAPYGVLTWALALEAGFTKSALRHAVRTGRFRRLLGRAYVDVRRPEAAGLRPVDLRVLAAGLTWPDGVVCLRTAALVHGMPVEDDGVVHMRVPPGRRQIGGLKASYFSTPERSEGLYLGVPTTLKRQTAIDCLSLLPAAEAERLMAWVRSRDLVSQRGLERAVEARAGRPGVAQLRRLVAETSTGALSALERRLHELLRGAGISGWLANQPVFDSTGRILARADVLFPGERLIIEADGKAYHQDFERERRRLNALTLAGYTVLRFTWQQVTAQPEDVVRQVREALALRAA